MTPITSAMWPSSEYAFRNPSHLQTMSTLNPEHRRVTLKQLFLTTRHRRSPLATVLNEQVNYSAMIPNNFTGTANHASYSYQVRQENNNSI